jgi:predicted DCC family thiol-disulfide oxidoreductase YuxK
MESWADLNYSMNDTHTWVKFMNISTVDFGVSYLPSNLIAISGSLSDAGNILLVNDTIVIENAGREQVGTSAISSVVYGVGAAAALLWACWWFYRTWVHDEFFQPRQRKFDAVEILLLDLPTNPDFVSADEFRTKIAPYYRHGETEHELREKDLAMEDLSSDDVETVIELIRRMYELDLKIWAKGNDRNVRAEELDALRRKSDAILREVHQVLGEWKGLPTVSPWPAEEMETLNEIFEILDHIGVKRYSEEVGAEE